MGDNEEGVERTVVSVGRSYSVGLCSMSVGNSCSVGPCSTYSSSKVSDVG